MTAWPPPVSRRTFLQAAASLAAVDPDSLAGVGTGRDARQRPDTSSVKALVFDVFGTVVDWRSSVARDVNELAARKGLKVDGTAFADAWRALYQPSMSRVRKGELPWTRLDDLHRMMLDKVLADFDITSLSDTDKRGLNTAWHRLEPWPDAVAGLQRLKKKFIIAPLSNGNIGLMTKLARHASLPWDCILGAELVRRYKPDPEVYRSAAEILDLERSAVMMVAAHLGDLRAARAEGLVTAFVPRPHEFGPNGKPELKGDGSVDVQAADFGDLARTLGA
jgi:2-haloacid dehalogenase